MPRPTYGFKSPSDPNDVMTNFTGDVRSARRVGNLEAQRIDDVAPIVPDQSPSTRVIVQVTHAAIVRDGLDTSCGIFMGNDTRINEAYGHAAARTDTVPPRQAKIRLMRRRLEPAARRHGDMAALNAGG